MYDVLIVDDEPMARAYLRHVTDWSACGFAVHSEAGNGLHALQLAKSHYYSLIVTDVRMPTMNGLEFISELRRFSDAAVVIISGYEDFEYARQGLQLGVQDYLLKPVVEDDLVAVLRKLREEIDRKNLVHKRLQLGVSALRDQFLRRWAHGQIGTKEYLDQRKLLHIDHPREGYFCMLIEMDFFQSTQDFGSDREVELKRFAIRNIIEEVCDDKAYVFDESEERYGLIGFGTGDDLQPDAIRRLAEHIVASVNKYTKDTVSIGLGDPITDIEALPRSYRRAAEALDGKFLMGNNAILDLRRADQVPIEKATIRAFEAKIVEAIRNRNRDQITATLLQLWSNFRERNLQPDTVKPIVLEILVLLFRMVNETGASHAQLFDYRLGDYEFVMKAKTSQELYRFTEKKCMNVLDLLHRVKDLQPSQIIQSILRMVEEQYNTNISMRSVAQQVYMNSAYLGKLFKTEMKCSFPDYVLKVRMEKAKELLGRTDLKVYEVAEKVGYQEMDWFYKRFKQYTGVSAGEYRTAVQHQRMLSLPID